MRDCRLSQPEPIRRPDAFAVCSLSTLVETVSKKPIPDHVRDVVFEVMVNDIDTDDDVEVSFSFSGLAMGAQSD